VDTLSRRKVIVGSAAAAFAGAATPPSQALAQATQPYADGDMLILEPAFKDTVFEGNVRVRLRAYNGQVPGPTITVTPGRTLRIRVRNRLTPYDSSGWPGNHNVPHALDTTNLHVHGLNVMPHLFEPLGTSDPAAPMIAIRPGEDKDYVFEIPADHPPGLYWYHPHHHGSTVVQAVTGMAGPIIVRGAIDEVPEIKSARDIALVVQDIGLFKSDTDPDLWTYEPKQNAIWQTFAGNVTIYDPKTGKDEPTNPPLNGGFTTGDYALRYYLLNGQPFFKEAHNSGTTPQTPTRAPAQFPIPTQLPVTRIQMAPGEVVRFRLLNGTSDNMIPLQVEGHDMHLIALDGVNFGAPRTIAPTPIDPNNNNTGQVLLASANRAEFLIQAVAQPGVYRILQLAQNQQFLFSAQKTIAEIEVVGPPKPMALPTSLPLPTREYPLIQPSEIKNIRQFIFAGNFPGVMNPYVGLDFLINNMQYQENAVATVVNLGDAEEWQIRVEGTHHGGTEGHPFHVHVNSFEVISVTDNMTNPPQVVTLPPGTIQDTIWVAEHTTVTIRTRFRQWTGKAVFHCHILPHEDTGMMQNLLILGKGGEHHH
jgi:FtsP/CotA-like multicopper oxidase with cupredoxin domain